jgi:hypothetical protein
MAAEVKLTGKPMEERIRDRLRDSGAGIGATHTVKVGEGPTRVNHHVHVHGTQGGAGNRLGRNDDGSGGGGKG